MGQRGKQTMDLTPVDAKSCSGPCLYWCSTKKHNAIRVGVLLLVFVVGIGVGILLMWVCARKRHTPNRKKKPKYHARTTTERPSCE